MNIEFLLLDMDGVLANFHAEAMRAHIRKGPIKTRYGTHADPMEAYELASNEKWPRGLSLQKYIGVSDIDEFWEPINKDPLFWRGIRPYTWYKRLVEIVGGYTQNLMLCTSPSHHHFSWGGKALWLELHGLSHLPCVMMGVNDKQNNKPNPAGKWLLAGPNRVLIDDFHRQTEPFQKAGGTSILFPQPWNDNHMHCEDPVGYTVEQLIKIHERPERITT